MTQILFQESFGGVPRLRSFGGRPVEEMPHLLTGTDQKGAKVDVKRTLVTPKQLLTERLHNTHEHDKMLLRNNRFVTSAAIIIDPDGSYETIVGLYRNPLVQELIDSLNPTNTLVYGSLPLPTELYQTIKEEAFVIDPKTARSLCLDHYTIKENRIKEGFWDYITEGDTTLTRETLRLLERPPYDIDPNKKMLLQISGNRGMRLLSIDSLHKNANSNAHRTHLEDSDGLLLGVVAEH